MNFSTYFFLLSILFSPLMIKAQEETNSDINPWLLSKVEGEKVKLPSGNKFFIVLAKDENKFSGYTSCNTFKGKLSLTKDSIRFEDLLMTERSCGPEIAALEKKVIAALSSSIKWKIEDDTLYLFGSQNEVLEFKSSTK